MGSVHSSATQNGQIQQALLLPYPRVCTTNGQIEGFRHALADGRPVNVFLGIPYAKPPVGELRFKKPQPSKDWHSTVLLAKKCRQRSIQQTFLHVDIAERRAGKSEDCLYLNVMAPGWKDPDEAIGFPVMFYIHGGAYLIDSAVKYNHKRVARALVRHGIVVVIIQYRLGLLGFFTTGDPCCPGNFGLWDQLAALHWTKENIAAFGGDPGRITIFGQSAGAASADLLGLSPLSRGTLFEDKRIWAVKFTDLFSQAILMGGNAECSWAVLAKEEAVHFCRKFALKLGFKCQQPVEGQWSREANERMMEFLKGLPASKFELNLLEMVRQLFDTMQLPIGPVVDGELLPQSPKLLRKECPPKRIIAGICKHEGMLFLALAMKRPNVKLLAKFERQLQLLAEEAHKKMVGNTKPIIPLVMNTKNIQDLYGINETLHKNKQAMKKICVLLLSDFVNNLGLHNFCEHHLANGSTVYRYLFEHFNPDNTRALNPFMPFKGATHGTELAFMFDVNMFVLPWRRTKADKEVRFY